MSRELERRYFAEAELEVRKGGAFGRLLKGVAITYGATALLKRLIRGRKVRRERFEHRAFGDVASADVVLNYMHQRTVPLARTGGGGLTLTDTGDRIELAAELPDTAAARDAVELVRSGVLRGLSVEFNATDETMDGDTRVVRTADLRGIGLVDRPAYRESIVEARRADHHPDRRRLLLL